LHSQSAFVQLPDATGYAHNTPQHLLDSLKSASTALQSALPQTYQSDFAVYDLGFYSHHTSMDGGIPEVISEAIANHITTPYYLLFGREMDDQGDLKQVWVEVELPEGGDLNCWTETNWVLSQKSVEYFVDSLVNEAGSKNILPAELLQMSVEKVKDIVESIKDCCISGDPLCAECPNPEDILQYYRGEGYTEEKIEILLDTFGNPLILDNDINPLVKNFSDYVYRSRDENMPEILDKNIDPFNSLLWEIEGLDAPEDYLVGVLLSNDNLCSSPPISALRSSNQEAIELFNSGFDIEENELVIVKHLWQNSDGSGNDLLFSRYLYATFGNLEDIPVPLNPGMLPGQTSPTIYEYELTDPNSSDAYEGMYEIAPDNNGTYFGWRIENGNWVKLDTVEVSTPYPTDHDPDQYLIGQQVAAKIEYEDIFYPPGPILRNRYRKFPCRWCYDYSIGHKKDTPTNDIIKWFYRWFGAGTSFQEEKDLVFNSFIYGQGQPLVWPASSSVSEALYSDDKIQSRLDASEDWLKNYIIDYGDLNGISSEPYHDLLLLSSSPNPNLSGVSFPSSLWTLQMFGGTQGREIRVVKYREVNNQDCSGKYIEIKFIFTLVDCFGLGTDERWQIPGLPWQWILQHYRNGYCCNFNAFHPVVYHKIEFEREFTICIE
ncbi:MAG: hypothetical protein EA411_09110, partial [Saprospirales bacterium]